MHKMPQVLLVAPNAPPKNSAEGIQVRRILAELDRHTGGVLVTVPPSSRWKPYDKSMELPLQHFSTYEMRLPWHRLSARVLMSHRMRAFQVPDEMRWITWMAGDVVRHLPRSMDIIYSRSTPMSSSILGWKLKQKLKLPWIMHLSDPWADNPDVVRHPSNAVKEAVCVRDADRIMLTTEKQAAHYRSKYPEYAHKVHVSPNMMPSDEEVQALLAKVTVPADERLHVVYAGNFYSDRTPRNLMRALEVLRTERPEIYRRLHIDVYGQAQGDSAAMLQHAPDVLHYHGPVSFEKAILAQAAADVILCIEVESGNPIMRWFLPSKMLDCLALRKPVLAVTPEGSEVMGLCKAGYGVFASPVGHEELMARLVELVEGLQALRSAPRKEPPDRYRAETVASELLAHMQQISRSA